MKGQDMTSNQHPVDELFAVRREIAKLEAREKELKALVLDMTAAERVGRNAEAAVVEQGRTTLDKMAVKRSMGEDWIEAHSTRSVVTIVKVREL